MMRFVTAFTVLLAALGVLGACSPVLQLGLFNDSGAPITVRAGDDIVAIAPGQFVQFDYPQDEANWTLSVSAGACDYRYQLPRAFVHYSWNFNQGERPKAQLERDFAVYLLPPNAAGIADVSALATQQVDGFPLHPVTRECH